MMRTPALLGALALVTPLTMLTPGLAGAASSPTVCSTATAPLAGHGSATALGRAAALARGVSEQTLDNLAAGDALVTGCGHVVVIDPALTPVAGAGRSSGGEPPAPRLARGIDLGVPVGSLLMPRLHSRPGSTHTIYLDFDGADLTGTQWASVGTPDPLLGLLAQAWDVTGLPALTDDVEQQIIAAIWTYVAEDYAPFDVDVTTVDPGVDGLRRSNAADRTYGTRVVLTPKNWVQRWCQRCTGVASLGVYGLVNDDAYQTAMVFPDSYARMLPTDQDGFARLVGGTIAHEVGHQLGLSHDGLTSASPFGAMEYHPGVKGWAPIMGSSSAPLVRWADGSYPWATNPEDDVAIIGSVLGTVPDEATRTLAPEVPINGVISSASDTDTVLLTPTRRLKVVVGGQPGVTDLDLALTVTDAQTSTVLAPVGARTKSTVTDMGVTFQALPGHSYSLTLAPSDTPGIASSYGSLGAYQITAVAAQKRPSRSVAADRDAVSSSSTRAALAAAS